MYSKIIGDICNPLNYLKNRYFFYPIIKPLKRTYNYHISSLNEYMLGGINKGIFDTKSFLTKTHLSICQLYANKL